MSRPIVVPEPALAPRVWRAGTLIYTSSGLAGLFGLLLLGDFAWSMRDRSVAPMAQWYLNNLGVSNLVFGLLVSSFPALLGLVLGPIISVKSDRHRGPRGRRIPFLLVTTPLAALGMIGLGVTPLLAQAVTSFLPGQSAEVIGLVCFTIFWAVFEFATIAGQAVFGGLINDVVPTALLGRFYGLFRAVSLVDGMIFNFWIMGWVPTHYTVILIILGIFYGTAFFWVCLRVREGGYPPPPRVSEEKNPVRGFVGEARNYARECFSNRYYLSVFLMLTAAALAFAPVNIYSIPYAKSLGVNMEVYGKFLALTYMISFGASYFLGWLADFFHPLRLAMATLAGYGIIAAWGGWAARTPELFLTAWVLHGVMSGCYFTGAASLGQRLFPHAKFAQFASAAGIFMGLGSLVLAPVVGGLIDLTGGNFRAAFFAGSALAFLALGFARQVHRRFLELGGPSSYAPPL